MKSLPRNVWILTIAQSLLMAVNSMVFFAGGIVGSKLAPTEKLATLPIASIIIGTAVIIVPITMLMKWLGRKKTFILIIIYSFFIALFALYSIHIGSFYLFVLCTFLFGATSATIMQFRFAAMESVQDDQHAQAASAVLIGGIAAAYIGPEVTMLGKDLLDAEFAGSFALLAIIFIISLGIILNFKNPKIRITSVQGEVRSLRVISKNNSFWVAIFSSAVGYAVMSYIMTATPLSMHVMDGHSLTHTKWVIQSHIMAMYLPSLVIGWLLQKFGHKRIMLTGLIAYILCMGMAFLSHALFNYWVALILLGVGWNFLFVGGTALLPGTYRPEERFKVQAFNEFIVFGSQAVAAISAGWMVFSFGWEIMLLTTIPFIIFQLVLIGRWKK